MIALARTIFEIWRVPGGWGVGSEIFEGVGVSTKHNSFFFVTIDHPAILQFTHGFTHEA